MTYLYGFDDGVELGQSVSFYIREMTAGYEYDITYECGGSSGHIQTVEYYPLTTKVEWTPPISLAEQAPNSTSVPVKIIMKKYPEGHVGGAVLETRTMTGTLKVPESIAPTIEGVTATDLSGCFDRYGKYVQNKTNLNVVVSAAGVYGSTISKVTTAIADSNFIGDNFTTPALTIVGNQELKTTVVDSRGRSASRTYPLAEILAYANPRIDTFAAYRCTKGGKADNEGDHMKITASVTVTELNKVNTGKMVIEYKESADENLTTALSENLLSGEVSVIVPASVDCSYDVVATLTDDFANTPRSTIVPSAFVLVDYYKDGTGIAFGKVATKPNTVESALPVILNDGLTVSTEEFPNDKNIEGVILTDESGNIYRLSLASLRSAMTDEHPVGSVHITSTNENPSEILGGTWELIDKEFKSQYLGSCTSAFTPTNCTVSICHVTLTGHAVQLRMQIKPTSELADSTVVLGNFAPSVLGVTSLSMGLRHYPLFSDDGNAVVIGYIDGTELSSRDVVVKGTATTVASGSLLTINVTWNLAYTYLIDEYCDKFYWKRTA